MTALNPFNAISPLDGRYRSDVLPLADYFSEAALMRYRLRVEVEYLIALSLETELKELPAFSTEIQAALRGCYENFSEADASAIKSLEATTNHDVKAVEYFLKNLISQHLPTVNTEWVHFALTSEDVNNLAYSLMWQEAVQRVYLPELGKVIGALRILAENQADTALLALTHGQPATPTTLGKEMAVFIARLQRQRDALEAHRLLGKLAGASGTWGAHQIACPEVDWPEFARGFITQLGLTPNLTVTQIESHDSLAESYHLLTRVNSILIDLCQDMWLYISREVFRQKAKKGEVGSSTMPHKVNPIQFENAEGNLKLANSYFHFLAEKLPVSRWQRDLTDSTTLRNQGMPLAHSFLALGNILKGLDRVAVNHAQIAAELDRHWEVLAEAIQTVLRKNGHPNPYEALKALTRGQTIDADAIRAFVSSLEMPDEEKAKLSALTPADYTGLAGKIARGEIA
ncbi:MAG: adenylosuccinate lyase [Lentisphaeria bacterium]|nr:adenylosuccinate lyase [Candidatus Neomarinimicrobiota bacterium]MCF7842003.1 adenylosuccinate lyase [Lentisphaeria bacterium]